MSKLSDLFGLGGGEAGAGKPAGRPNGKRTNSDGDHIAAEHYSSVGSRMGEENEALRNLLSDTGRKINELDDLKSAFDKIVTPFNNTLRALEEEKSQNLSLKGMLTESRAAYDTLRSEFYQIEKRATLLETENERLREDLELSRETVRSLESSRSDLNNQISSQGMQINEIERQLAHETSQRRTLSDNKRTLTEQFDAAEKRSIELEGELAAARERLALLEDEKRSLQSAYEQATSENGRLTRRLTESENTLTSTRAQLGKVETNFAEAHAERGRLAAALDETRDHHQTEHNSLNMRLDALQSRAATAEKLLTEARQNLIARTEEVRAFDRKAVEATIARNSADKRLAQIEVDARSPRTADQGPRTVSRCAGRTHQRAHQDTQDPRDGAQPRRRTHPATHRAHRAPRGRHPGQPHQYRTACRGPLGGSLSASAWNAPSWKARWKLREKTIPGCKAKSARCAPRCAVASSTTTKRRVSPREPKRRPSPSAAKAARTSSRSLNPRQPAFYCGQSRDKFPRCAFAQGPYVRNPTADAALSLLTIKKKQAGDERTGTTSGGSRRCRTTGRPATAAVRRLATGWFSPAD